MALDSTALVTVADFKTAYGGVAGSNKDESIERAINSASAIVHLELGRKLCDASLTTPWTRTEYHSLCHHTNELWLMDWPIVSITSVHEDGTRAYGASALLVADTDYIVDKTNGKLLRVGSSGGATSWLTGFEAIKVVGVLGYQSHNLVPTTAQAPGIIPVPSDIKDVVCWIAGRLFQEGERRQYDVQSQTDATGTVTRFSASRLPPMMRERLASHRARLGTGRRAA